MPKVYCKYCDQYVRLEAGDGIFECSECGYGLASMDDVALHGSYKRMVECDTVRFAVMREAIKYFGLRGTSEDMDKCYADCPHIIRGQRGLRGEELIAEIKKKVGLP